MQTTLGLVDALTISCTILLFVLASAYRQKRNERLPPGPRGLPLIGNALQIPKMNTWKTFSQWRDKYGPVVYCSVYGQPVVILNTPEAIFELLERRGANYSDRPSQYLLDLCGWSNSAGQLQYGARLTQMRRLILKVGGKAGVEKYSHILSEERHRFLRRLLENPGAGYVNHLKISTAQTIIDINYGHDLQEDNDPLIGVLDNGINAILPVLDPKVFADYYPIFRFLPTFFPNMSLHRMAQNASVPLTEAANKPLTFVKEQMTTGIARPSFTADHLADEKLTPDIEDLIRWASLTIYGVGFETTVMAISHFVSAMVLYPEVQRRAQAELDTVVGTSRLPTLADCTNLPYLMAIVKETLRWIPLAPDGVPHQARHDDVYLGHDIPAKSTVIPNLCGVLHNPHIFQQPENFNPDRFLGERPEPDPSNFAFGFGRRICAGKHFAEASIYLHASALLSVFNVRGAIEAQQINREDWDNIPRYPSMLPCSFEPRSPEARALITAINYRGETIEAAVNP